MINKNQRCEMVLLLKPLQNISILIVQIVLMVLIFIILSLSFVYHVWFLVIFLSIQIVFSL